MRRWWQGLGSREQRALTALAVVGLPGILYLGVLQPLHQSEALARQRMLAAAAVAQRMAAVVAEAEALRKHAGPKRNAPLSGPLLSLVETTSHAFLPDGAIARITPTASGSVQVSLPQVEFDGLLEWLRQLSGEYDVVAEQVTATSTSSPGVVRVEMALKAL